MKDFNWIYTNCFIKQNNNIIMLNRVFEPNMGLWNGVGGKIEEGETPLQCVLREVVEETGLLIDHAEFKGIVTWKGEGLSEGGMYVYKAELTDSIRYETPIMTDEGILHWKSIEWVLDPKNSGIVSNIHYFLPSLLYQQNCYQFDCVYSEGFLQDVKTSFYQESL